MFPKNTVFCRFVPLIARLGGFTLEGFKAILDLDDREDALSRFCLTTATFTIERYCKQRFLRRKNTDCLTFMGEYIFSLWEYPVRKVLSVHVQKIRLHADFLNRSFCGAKTTAEASETPPSLVETVQWGEPLFSPANLVDPKHYYCLPDEDIQEDIPFPLILRPLFHLVMNEMGIRIWYLAGDMRRERLRLIWPRSASNRRPGI